MGRHLEKGLPSLLVLLETEKAKSQRSAAGFRAQQGKSQTLRGDTQPSEATKEKASRKILGARSPPGSLVEGGAEFLPSGECAEPRGCETRKAGVGGISALTRFKSLGQE